MLLDITPIVLTYNEQPNLQRTLAALSWANEILVVDSFSTDNTLAICAEYNNVRVVQHAFESFAQQCNFALQQNIKTQWVLSMDADYVVTPNLSTELNTLAPEEHTHGYQIDFQYLINGKPLNGSLYPPRICLYRREQAHYQQDGHAHRVIVKGNIGQLSEKIQHDDRKPYSRWLNSQKKYARQEADKLAHAKWHTLSWPDRLRVLGVAPLVIVPYTLLIKGLIRNGVAGLEYSWQRFIAEMYLQQARLPSHPSK